MILFNYALSPYAEKIRSMLGYTDTAWQSVTVPPMPPRKGLDVLAGGYRRVPVAQIGADVFCDSRIICDELAVVTGKPELSLFSCDADVANFASTLEREKFMAAVRAVPPRAMLKRVVREHLPHTIFKLLRDRGRMASNAAMKMPGGRSSSKLYAELLGELEAHLQNEFLFGTAPCIADFSAYHLLWFNCDIGSQAFPADLTRVPAWYARMHAFGHGQRETKNMRYALAQAKNAEPRALDASLKTASVGSEITIAPDDYAHDSVSGVLVGESESRWVVARDTRECGTLHLHFPKVGYAVS